MDSGFLLRGFIIGVSIAAAVGPMCILCIQRTLARGYVYGLISAMGIATADAIYGSIAGFGLAIVAAFLVSQQMWIRLVGGLFLLYLGIRTLLSSPAERAAKATSTHSFFGAYTSTLLLTLTNPLTILSFAAIFAGIGVGATSNNALAAALVVGGVFLGSATWWLMLTGAIGLLRGRFTPGWLLWLNRISGAVIVAFGVWVAVSLVVR